MALENEESEVEGRLRRLPEPVRVRLTAAEERARLTALVQQAPLPMAVYDGPAHRIVLANERYVELCGSDIVGISAREAFPHLEASGIFEALDEVWRTGLPRRIEELAAPPSPGGEERYFTSVLQPVCGGDGRITGMTSVGYEVTEQVLARRKLEEQGRITGEALARAEQAARAKDEFLAMLGHELRNPLSPILTALQLMRLRGQASREQAIIERQVAHLVRLVDDLLDVSRITRGKIELRRERLEASEIVARAIEMASPLLEERRHELVIDVRRRGLLLDADPARLAQVISNLLNNAAKYSEPGGRIEVSASRARGQIRIRVRDHGIGIPSEMLARIFDVFVQQTQAKDRALGGLGLGLAIVRSLVELHGGTVTAHSDGLGKGSNFVVELPAAVHRLPSEDGDDLRRDAETEELRLGERILIVDDNEDAGLLLADALEELGYAVRVAHDGPSALQAADEFQPQLALLDIGLPVMDGHEVGRRLRARAWGAKLRLVAITGYGQESDKRASRAAGFDAHLVKPIDVDHLAGVIADLRRR